MFQTLTAPPLTLETALTDAVGDAAAKKLKTLGLVTVEDLISHWPRRWRERGEEIDLALVPDGDPATASVLVRSTFLKKMRNGRQMYVCKCITTHGRELEVSIFSPWQAKKDGIVEGARVTFSGKVKSFRGKRQMSSPEYFLETADGPSSTDLAGTIVPIYPATAKASSEFIWEQMLAVLDQVGPMEDHLPLHLLVERDLPGYDWAVRTMHQPSSIEDANKARHRLTYDEAFSVQLSLALRRHGAEAIPTRPLPGAVAGLRAAFDARLPFELTPGQASAGEKLADAMNSTRPMNALVLGEVGSGKTVVAMRIMLQAIDSGSQAVFLAPTEVLAAQHYEGLSKMVEGLDVRVALLTGSMPARQRKEIEYAISQGDVDLIVGTHTLLNTKAGFHRLGLVVVDEQHRFGVAQRDQLRAQPMPPHQLVMTATPIPRTMAMTVYGDLDVISLDGLPGGRKPITSVVVPSQNPVWANRVWTRMGEEIAQGRQVFIVASLIDHGDEEAAVTAKTQALPNPDSENVDTLWADESVNTVPALSIYDLETQARQRLPHARVGVLHGKMEPEEKNDIMSRFSAGDVDILVSTTVIEVGVNVPNATVMAIWDADRFGIAQLHQLRGRVGRGGHAGLCLLVTATPDEHPARVRLDQVAGTLDGFKLAEADLKNRREGDILGTGQSGKSRFKFLDLTSGSRLIGQARKDADQIIRDDPALRSNPALATWLHETLGEAAGNLGRA